MRATLLCGAFGVSGSIAVAQTAGTDNRDGSYVNFEEAPIHPVELVESEGELWVANVAAGTVSVFSVPGLALQDEIPVGMGPVTVRRRPDSGEMWVACASSGALFVVDRATRQVIDSFMPGAPVSGVEIPLEPAGLIFSPAGDKAYCTLSMADQIVEIDAATRTVARRIEFSTRFPDPINSPLVHAEEPRALLLDGTTLQVLSFESGNGTSASAGLTNSTMVDMWDLFLNPPPPFGPFPPPPDRDVLSFDLSVAAPEGSIALWRMGTLCFDFERRAGSSELLVSNIDANNLLDGEFNFPLSGIARHRISRATPGGATVPQATTHVDLNLAADRHPLLPTSAVLFALPNEIEQTAAGLLFACCYDTRNTAVVDLATNQVIASLAASGFGPRGLALDAAAQHAWVFNRADATIDEFSLVGLAPGAQLAPTASVAVGFDPTPAHVKSGRLVHIDATNSSTGTQSCNTCHVDGHADRIAWLLGEFTGSLPTLPVVKEDKKVKVTQSLRGIEETAPFHWRGDRADLDAFNPAFEGLLGGAQLSPADFADFQAFVFSLTFPANPNQLPSRELSNGAIVNAKRGKLAFETLPILRIAADTIAPHSDLNIACAACHSLGGFNGTDNQVVNDVTQPTFADNPAHLRGLFDKDSEDVVYPVGTFNGPGFGSLNRTVATGWGTANNGFGDALKNFVVDLFNGPPSAETAITQFVNEFDSGTAIAAMWSFTLTPAKAGSPATSPVATYLMPQATAGNCDLAVKGLLAGAVRVGFLFDPASQLFLSDRASIAPQSLAQLDALAAAGATFSFLGVPFAAGRRIAVDRDLDFLLDGDEVTTSPTVADSDGDAFLDGYEVRNGTDPANPASVPGNLTPPAIVASQLVFQNSVLAKFRWTTDVEASARIRIRDAGTNLLLSTTIDRRQLRHHVMVVRKLDPGRAYVAEIDGADQNGNFTAVTTINFTASSHFLQSVHTDAVTLVTNGTNPSGTEDLVATITVKGEDGAAATGATVTGRFIEWTNGVAATITGFTVTTATGSVVSATYPSLHPLGSGATVEVVVDSITTPAGELHFHPHEVNFSAKFQL